MHCIIFRERHSLSPHSPWLCGCGYGCGGWCVNFHQNKNVVSSFVNSWEFVFGNRHVCRIHSGGAHRLRQNCVRHAHLPMLDGGNERRKLITFFLPNLLAQLSILHSTNEHFIHRLRHPESTRQPSLRDKGTYHISSYFISFSAASGFGHISHVDEIMWMLEFIKQFHSCLHGIYFLCICAGEWESGGVWTAMDESSECDVRVSTSSHIHSHLLQFHWDNICLTVLLTTDVKSSLSIGIAVASALALSESSRVSECVDSMQQMYQFYWFTIEKYRIAVRRMSDINAEITSSKWIQHRFR